MPGIDASKSRPLTLSPQPARTSARPLLPDACASLLPPRGSLRRPCRPRPTHASRRRGGGGTRAVARAARNRTDLPRSRRPKWSTTTGRRRRARPRSSRPRTRRYDGRRRAAAAPPTRPSTSRRRASSLYRRSSPLAVGSNHTRQSHAHGSVASPVDRMAHRTDPVQAKQATEDDDWTPPPSSSPVKPPPGKKVCRHRVAFPMLARAASGGGATLGRLSSGPISKPAI